jgi:nitroreductase
MGALMHGNVLQSLIPSVSPPGKPIANQGNELSDEMLERVLTAARIAPSADNAQTWRFITIRSEEMKKRLAKAIPGNMGETLPSFPVVLVLCGVPWIITRLRREQPFVFMDVPIALTHLLLRLTELEIAFQWTMDVQEEAIREALSIPDKVRVVALLGMG